MTAGLGVVPAHIVATRQSKQNADHIWVATSDGHIHLVDWTEASTIISTFQTSSNTAKAMVIGKVTIAGAEQEIVLVLEATAGGSDLVGYSSAQGSSPLSKTLLQVNKQPANFHLLDASDCGQFLVGAVHDRLFVGSVAQKPLQTIEDLAYEVIGFDTPDIVTAVDLKTRRKKQGKAAKKEIADILDVLIGGARGAIYIYNDVLANLKELIRQPTQPQKLHWHRRAVHSAKWSRDGR